jgi:predicted GNAT family acetyltransferase
MKQTAVEWLVSQLNKQGFAQVVTDEEIKKAKEMEKEQIIEAHEEGFYSPPFRMSRRREAKQYYNETYKK